MITNRHVIEGAIELDVETWDGHVHTVTVADQSTRADLAVIRLDEPLPYAPLSVADTAPRTGDPLTVAGYPLNGPYTANSGSAVGTEPGDAYGQPFNEVLRMDVTVRPGNSGGPVLNDTGELVAVVYAIDRASGDGLAVPASLIDELLAGLDGEPVRDCLNIPLG